MSALRVVRALPLENRFLSQFLRISGVVEACWHASGVRFSFSCKPGVSLRLTPGYLLSSLRDEEA